MNENIYTWLLYTHITGGTAALILGFIAMSTKKGQRLHKTSGKGYLLGMLLAIISALVMCVLKPNPFLFSIAIFTAYMMYTGWRSIQNKLFEALWYDWLMSIAAIITGVWMITQMMVVLMVFGGITAAMGVQDALLYYRSRTQTPKKLSWLQTHIGRMIGSYIATSTAVLVVNVQIQPYWVPWLAPTVVGSFFIAYFMRKHGLGRKLN